MSRSRISYWGHFWLRRRRLLNVREWNYPWLNLRSGDWRWRCGLPAEGTAFSEGTWLISKFNRNWLWSCLRFWWFFFLPPFPPNRHFRYRKSAFWTIYCAGMAFYYLVSAIRADLNRNWFHLSFYTKTYHLWNSMSLLPKYLIECF